MEASIVSFANSQLELLSNELRKITDAVSSHLAEAERLRLGAEQLKGAIAAYQAVANMWNTTAENRSKSPKYI